MSIIVKDIHKFFGDQEAVKNLSFEAHENQIIGLLGPNGAGKSTTLKMLTGILPPSSGEVSIFGQNYAEHARSIKSIIGYLPENNPLYPEMYVKEILAFEADIHHLKNKKDRIAQVIEQTGLQPEQHKKINQLSKGYQQRVGLAMAILHDPKILILDEPTSGLDPNQIIEIRSLIQMLGKQKTVIFSSHILQEVASICDRILILDHGQLNADFAYQEMSHLYPGKTLEEVFVLNTIAH